MQCECQDDIVAQLLAMKQELSSLSFGRSTCSTQQRKSPVRRQSCVEPGTGSDASSPFKKSARSENGAGSDKKKGEVRVFTSNMKTRTQPKHSIPPSTPPPANSQHRNEILKRSSSLDFELMVWKRAAGRAARKAQLQELAAFKLAALRGLQQFSPDIRTELSSRQLETKACTNRTFKQRNGGIVSKLDREHDVRVSTIESAAFFQLRIMAALTLFIASISCLYCALCAV
jgi:hypothetical protein